MTTDRQLLHAYAVTQYDSSISAMYSMRDQGIEIELSTIHQHRQLLDSLLKLWAKDYGIGWNTAEDLDTITFHVREWVTEHVIDLDEMLVRKGIR